jgi:hypothetical protein
LPLLASTVSPRGRQNKAPGCLGSDARSWIRLYLILTLRFWFSLLVFILRSIWAERLCDASQLGGATLLVGTGFFIAIIIVPSRRVPE